LGFCFLWLLLLLLLLLMMLLLLLLLLLFLLLGGEGRLRAEARVVWEAVVQLVVEIKLVLAEERKAGRLHNVRPLAKDHNVEGLHLVRATVLLGAKARQPQR
jgi:hypothetical protein